MYCDRSIAMEGWELKLIIHINLSESQPYLNFPRN